MSETQELVLPELQTLIFKLATGEDLISLAYHMITENVEDVHFYLVEPMMLVTGYDPEEETTATILIPWISRNLVDQSLYRLSAMEITTFLKPSSSLYKAYHLKVNDFIQQDEMRERRRKAQEKEDKQRDKQRDKLVKKELRQLAKLDKLEDKEVESFVENYLMNLKSRKRIKKPKR